MTSFGHKYFAWDSRFYYFSLLFSLYQISPQVNKFNPRFFFSEVISKYTQELNKLGHEVLEMLCEGLGLKPEYFIGELSENPVVLAHHFPPCPEPSLTLGLAKHRDPTLITILLQDQEVHGLQILKDDEWIPVEPIPNAFVVNIGLILQVKLHIHLYLLPFFLSFHLTYNLSYEARIRTRHGH